jgi:hypothetical protein
MFDVFSLLWVKISDFSCCFIYICAGAIQTKLTAHGNTNWVLRYPTSVFTAICYKIKICYWENASLFVVMCLQSL